MRKQLEADGNVLIVEPIIIASAIFNWILWFVRIIALIKIYYSGSNCSTERFVLPVCWFSIFYTLRRHVMAPLVTTHTCYVNKKSEWLKIYKPCYKRKTLLLPKYFNKLTVGRDYINDVVLKELGSILAPVDLSEGSRAYGLFNTSINIIFTSLWIGEPLD